MARPTPNSPRAKKAREELFQRAHTAASLSFLQPPGTLETPEEVETRSLAKRVWENGGQRWRRLDLPLKDAARFLRASTSRLLEEPDQLTKQSDPAAADWNWAFIHESRLYERLCLAVLGHLEVIPADMRPWTDWRRYAIEAGVLAEHYFYGDWRESYRRFSYETPMTREEARRKLPWIDAYRAGLLLALLVDDERGIDRVTSWPGGDLPADEGTFDLPAAYAQYHIHLARALRTGTASSGASFADLRRPGGRVRPLAEAVDAALTGNAEAFGRALKEHLTGYRKSVFRLNRPDAIISIEGSILWHIARRRGLQLPDLRENQMDLVLR